MQLVAEAKENNASPICARPCPLEFVLCRQHKLLNSHNLSIWCIAFCKKPGCNSWVDAVLFAYLGFISFYAEMHTSSCPVFSTSQVRQGLVAVNFFL